jgi:cytochrome c oxidase cbb3-type subunit 1
MWRTYDEMGFLQYSFVETVMEMHPYYVLRALGGLLFLAGSLIMVYNLWRPPCMTKVWKMTPHWWLVRRP